MNSAYPDNCRQSDLDAVDLDSAEPGHCDTCSGLECESLRATSQGETCCLCAAEFRPFAFCDPCWDKKLARQCRHEGKARRGYVHIRGMHGHPVATVDGRVSTHRAIAERAAGIFLMPPVEVHHLNKVRDDNRNGNLVVCPDHSYHMLLHRRQRILAAGGDPDKHRICTTCKEVRPISEFCSNAARRDGRHNHCAKCVGIASRDYWKRTGYKNPNPRAANQKYRASRHIRKDGDILCGCGRYIGLFGFGMHAKLCPEVSACDGCGKWCLDLHGGRDMEINERLVAVPATCCLCRFEVELEWLGINAALDACDACNERMRRSVEDVRLRA